MAADWAIEAPARNRAAPAEHFAQQNLRERNKPAKIHRKRNTQPNAPHPFSTTTARDKSPPAAGGVAARA